MSDEPVFKRRCTGCGRVLPMDAAHFHRQPKPPYFRGDCKDCVRAKQDEWDHKSKNRLRQQAREEAHTRLRRMHPELWRKALADAYERRGLEPPQERKAADGRR